MSQRPLIQGTVAPEFAHVREVFEENFTERGEVGASVSVWIDGAPVVDLWAGLRDRDTAEPWTEDTLAVMFSATKGLVAIAFLMLEDRGEIDLDATVASYWPEFASGGKSDVTVRSLLNHRAGLCAVDAPLTLHSFSDWSAVAATIADQAPLWPPGTSQGYGATAWGMYAGALFHKITGETVGRFLQREVFEPLEADVFLGLPDDEQPRVATLYPVPKREMLRLVLPKVATQYGVEGRAYRRLITDKQSDTARAFLNPSLGKQRLNVLNEPWTRALELPWMNACATANGLAKVYAALAVGGKLGKTRLVRKAAIERVRAKQSWSFDDRVLCKPLGFSQGFAKDEAHLISPNEAAFGHTGAGGTVGFADPTHKLSMAYLMNRMDHHIRSPRCVALCRAVYEVLGCA